jgi:2-amino-4-hydroxy-6-hydroxymethyldihydropteridine diphosphokinase
MENLEIVGDRLDQAVIIGLGSNLPGNYGSSEALLEAALARFPTIGLTVLCRSDWWRSAAWPDPRAPDYRNGVAIVATDLPAREVLLSLLGLEAAFGRTRPASNAPRTLDLDLIAYGRAIIGEPDLIVPHPRAHERLFVIGPLAAIAPGWRHPVIGLTAAVLAMSAPIGADAKPA